MNKGKLVEPTKSTSRGTAQDGVIKYAVQSLHKSEEEQSIFASALVPPPPVAAGADVNKVNLDAKTAMEMAISKGNIDCIEVLIKEGADVNRRNSQGFTPLCVCVSKDSTEMMDLLIKAGADVNGQSSDGTTPLLLAARHGSGETMKLLVNTGADVNNLCSGGESFLTESVGYAASIDKLKILLRAGAMVNRYNRYGQNALMKHVAHSSGDRQRVMMIMATRGQHLLDQTDEATRGNFNRQNQDIGMLLFAAGERVQEIGELNFDQFGIAGKQQSIPDYLQFSDLKLNLKHLCRIAIRDHLLDLDPNENLFIRIPQLNLPNVLKKYLLFDSALEEESK